MLSKFVMFSLQSQKIRVSKVETKKAAILVNYYNIKMPSYQTIKFILNSFYIYENKKKNFFSFKWKCMIE